MRATGPHLQDRSPLAARTALAALSGGAGVIHLVMVGSHLGVWGEMIFFGLVGLAQLAWAVRILSGAPRGLLTAGAVGNAAVFGVWVLSRTVGVPAGAHAGAVLSVGVADGLGMLLHAALVVGTVSLRRLPSRAGGQRRLVVAASWIVAGAVIPVMLGSVTAIAGGAHDHGHERCEPHAHGEPQGLDEGGDGGHQDHDRAEHDH